jgi:hypothetical protein
LRSRAIPFCKHRCRDLLWQTIDETSKARAIHNRTLHIGVTLSFCNTVV